MLKKEITYTDYDGNERTEEFRFNLTKSEIIELEMSVVGGWTKQMQKALAEQNAPLLMEQFKKLILKAYGEIAADSRRFVKSEELSTAFSQTAAYDELFMEIFTDPEKQEVFMKAIITKEEDHESAAPAQMRLQD